MVTAVKPAENPIVFRASLVKAILAGEKSQTRRYVKGAEDFTDATRVLDPSNNHREFWRFSLSWDGGTQCHDLECPFGSPGDLLWVKETLIERDGNAIYAADGEPAYGVHGEPIAWRWKTRGLSSRSMPRHASRILLRLEEVRVQRLLSISGVDAQAEGFLRFRECEAVMRFLNLWEELHGDGSAEVDPWIWALTFSREE